MKPDCRKRSLTFGEFIARVYGVCGKRKGRGIVRRAIQAIAIEFLGQQRYVVS